MEDLKMNTKDMNLTDLTKKESQEIFGGDKFMYALGNSIGQIGRWLHSSSQRWLESIGNGNLYHPGKI